MKVTRWWWCDWRLKRCSDIIENGRSTRGNDEAWHLFSCVVIKFFSINGWQLPKWKNQTQIRRGLWFIESENRLNKLITLNIFTNSNNLIFIPFHPFFFLCLWPGASLAAQNLFIFSNSPILSTCDTFKYMVIALKEESSSAKNISRRMMKGHQDRNQNEASFSIFFFSLTRPTKEELKMTWNLSYR